MPTTNPAVTGTLAVGQIPYTNLVHRSGPDVVLGSDNLWWAAAEARLGVGLAGVTPSAKIHAAGDGAPAARPLALRVDGTSAARGELFFGDISLSTYGSEEVVFEICTPARASTRSRGFRYAGGAQTSVAGSELIDVNFAPSSVQFSTGTTLALQRGVDVSAPTYSATSAKTISEAATLTLAAPVAGTNVTWGTNSGLASRVFGLKITGAGGIHVSVTSTSGLPGHAYEFCIGSGSITGITSSQEYVSHIIGREAGVDSVQWSTNVPTTQRWIMMQGPQYACNTGGRTITDASTLYVDPPNGGTNVTITNAWAIYANGRIRTTGNIQIGSSFTLSITSNDRIISSSASGIFMTASAAGGTNSAGIINAGGSSFHVRADATNNRTMIGYSTTAPTRAICLFGTQAGGNVASVRNESSTGLSCFVAEDDSGTGHGSFGYANTGFSGDAVSAGRTGILLSGTTDFLIRTSASTVGLLFSDSNRRWSFGTDTQASDDVLVAQIVRTTGSPTALRVTGAAHTTLSNAEASSVAFNLAQTVQFGQNTTLATQRAIAISAPTYSSSAATKTITDAVTLDINAAPAAGTNVTITNAYALRVQAGEARLLGGLRVTGNTGFFGAAAVAQQTVGAVTNSVTSGGVNGTIADYTIVDYDTDSATIRNDLYQLARSVAQIATAVRNLGLGA